MQPSAPLRTSVPPPPPSRTPEADLAESTIHRHASQLLRSEASTSTDGFGNPRSPNDSAGSHHSSDPVTLRQPFPAPVDEGHSAADRVELSDRDDESTNTRGDTSHYPDHFFSGSRLTRHTLSVEPPPTSHPWNQLSRQDSGRDIGASENGDAVAGAAPAVPMPATSSLNTDEAMEDFWVNIERHLLAAYSVLRDGDENVQRPLKAPKHQMGWYAMVYNACSGDPAKAQEMYQRLALVIQKVLEVHVLYPIVQQADRSRLQLITGSADDDDDDTALAAATTSGATSADVVAAERRRATLAFHQSTELAAADAATNRAGNSVSNGSFGGRLFSRNGSFRLVKRLFFGGSDADDPREGALNSSSAVPSSTGAALLPSGISSSSPLQEATSFAGAGGVTVAEAGPAAAHGGGGGGGGATAYSSNSSDASPQHLTSAAHAAWHNAASSTNHSIASRRSPLTGRIDAEEETLEMSIEMAAPLTVVPGQGVLPSTAGGVPGPLPVSHSHSVSSPSITVTSPDGAGRAHSFSGISSGSHHPPRSADSSTGGDDFILQPDAGADGGGGESGLRSSDGHPHGDVAGPRTGCELLRPPSTGSLSTERENGNVREERGGSGTPSGTPSAETAQPADNVRARSQRRGSVRQHHHNTLCYTFVRECAAFNGFRRVVLSCFRYLDQYYTKRFGMDTVGAMCVKLFYVVVYEPLKAIILLEMRSYVSYLREEHERGRDVPEVLELLSDTLGLLFELFDAVRTTSSYLVPGVHRASSATDAPTVSTSGSLRAVAPAAAATTASTASSMNPHGLVVPATTAATSSSFPSTLLPQTDGVASAASSARSTPRLHPEDQRQQPAGRRLWTLLGGGGRHDSAAPPPLPTESAAAVSSAPVSPSLNSNTPVPAPEGAVESTTKAGTSAGAFPSSPSQIVAPPPQPPRRLPPLIVDLRGTIELRVRLVSSSLSHSLARQALKHSENVRRHTGAQLTHRKSDGAVIGTIIKAITQPLDTLVMDEFGRAHLDAMEAFYQAERVSHLATAAGRRYYTSWYRGVASMECRLVSLVDSLEFQRTLRRTLARVLVVEVHRTLILDPDCGFAALLEVWDGTRVDDELTTAILSRGAGAALSGSTGGGIVEAAKRSGRPVRPDPTMQALSLFFAMYESTEDDTCLLLLGTVLASKLIRDAAAHLERYAATFPSGTEDGGGAGSAHEARRGGGGGCGNGPQQPPTASARRSHSPSAGWASSSPLSPQQAAFSGSPSPTTSAAPSMASASAEANAGNVLMEALLSLSIRYDDLVTHAFHENAFMARAVSDALATVLNPTRWCRTSAASSAAIYAAKAAAEWRARSTGLFDSQVPTVLLSRDAGRKALAPLLEVSAHVPASFEINVERLLAHYADNLFLRELAGHVDASTQSARFTHMAYFATLLDSKDLFLETYKVRLARRLLGAAGPPNLDAEKVFVQCLHQRLGAACTHSFEAMLRDCDSNAALQEGFAQTTAYAALPAPIRVQLLTSSQWPAYSTWELRPHVSLQMAMDAFHTHYLQLHPSRALRWIHLLGSATLQGQFPLCGVKEIIANNAQANILLHVSDACNRPPEEDASIAMVGEGSTGKDDDGVQRHRVRATNSGRPVTISGKEIAEKMEVPFSEIRLQLGSLCLHRGFALLTRETGSVAFSPTTTTTATATKATAAAVRASLSESDRFTLNRGFTHTARRVKLPVPRARPGMGLGAGALAMGEGNGLGGGPQDVQQTVILAARKQQLDVAIVRLMKSRRVLPYQELVDLVVKQVARLFQPSSRDIKACLESLVNRDFLRRCGDDKNSFEYIA